jgi:DNA primase catalytic subunit
LDLLFDTDADYYPELIENLESGFWQHMIVRVEAKYDGKVMGSDYLGSVVAESPAAWLKEQEEGDNHIDHMIETALDEARKEAVRMLDILKQDFLQ